MTSGTSMCRSDAHDMQSKFAGKRTFDSRDETVQLVLRSQAPRISKSFSEFFSRRCRRSQRIMRGGESTMPEYRLSPVVDGDDHPRLLECSSLTSNEIKTCGKYSTFVSPCSSTRSTTGRSGEPHSERMFNTSHLENSKNDFSDLSDPNLDSLDTGWLK